jgi:GTP-binding protein
MSNMQIKEARFVTSNTNHQKCPPPDLPEYAFIGRSNVGKSSLINMLAGRKALAKISGTPGKTQLINHFIINEQWYLVDLPGYGFARVSKSLRQKWENMIWNYLINRQNLISTFILVDIRLKPQPSDLELITWFGEENLPFVILFTKIDKLSKRQLSQNLQNYKETLLKQWEELPLSFLTSAKTSAGREEIISFIDKSIQAYPNDRID